MSNDQKLSDIRNTDGSRATNSLASARKDLEALATALGRGDAGREVALAITKAQEAEHWLTAALAKLPVVEGSDKPTVPNYVRHG